MYEQLERVRTQGNTLLSEWKQQDLAKLGEGQQNIKRLADALQSCNKLYQDIVAQQAAETIKGISNFENVPTSSDETKVALEDVDVFNVLPDVDVFSSGFQELESEFFRLKSEEEARRSIIS